MPDDRYAPPQAPLVDEARWVGNADGEFEIGRALSDGWNATWAHFPLWLGVFTVGGLMLIASFFIPPVLGLFLVAPVIAWGLVVFTLNMMDGNAAFSDLFTGFSQYGTALVSVLVLVVAMTLVGTLGQLVYFVGAAAESTFVMVVGWFLNLAWSLFVVARLYFAWFFIVDQGLGPTEAMQASWDATRGQSLRTAGLIAVGIVVILAGALVFLVGAIPATVVFYLMWASAYRQMVGRPAPARPAFDPPAAPAS